MKDNVEAYVELAIETGQKMGVDLIIARGTDKIINQIRFSQNKIDINKEWRSETLDVLIVVNSNQVSTSEFSPSNEETVRERILDQVAFTKKLAPSPFYLGCESSLNSYSTIEKLYDNKISGYQEKAPDYVNACIQSALDAGAVRVAGSFFFGQNHMLLKSSAGPQGKYSHSSYEMTTRAFQDELDASGQGLACGRMVSDSMEALQKAGERAGRYSKLHKGAKQAHAGIYDVIMAPAVAANLLGTIPTMANPLMIMMGMSALGDKMGEQLGPDFLSVSDNGLLANGLRSAPFDFEGTPRKVTPIFTNGVLKNYINNTSSAIMSQAESTGNSELVDFGIGSKFLAPYSSNVVFNNGDQSFDEILETNSRKCIFILCNWYTRYTSQISTEYSTIPRDAAFVVKNGELSAPIKNFRISDNLLRQFAAIDAMCNDLVQVKWWEVTSPTWIPTIRVKDCRITTATQ
ncbi:MAG: TldD/PmbA family protein [Candidatus Heimdallarchaeota archaeon]|nr:TldD/PmbA family protein [Candidatus Heimdallarchaeota archaeon]